MRDIGGLWNRFFQEGIAARIAGRLDDHMLGVYHAYDGDHTQPYGYFVGCRVTTNAALPEGLDELHVPQGAYQIVVAEGKMPDCVMEAWQGIWESDIPRAYGHDYEVYLPPGDGSTPDRVDIYLSVKAGSMPAREGL